MVAQRRQAAQAGASRRSAAAERTRLRHKWRRQLETIHRKAGDLMTEMLRELGDEHIATDRLDSILAEASLLLDALDRPTDNFWGLT
jgi:hypothetical protein